MLIETSEIIEVIANKYGYNIDAKEHYDWAYYYSSGCKEIDNGSLYCGLHQLEHMVVTQWRFAVIKHLKRKLVGGYFKVLIRKSFMNFVTDILLQLDIMICQDI